MATSKATPSASSHRDGAYIINAGVAILRASDEAAAGMHGLASGTYPFLRKLKPMNFARLPGLYAKTSGMRRPGTPLPTQEGTALAKDIWMAGIALSLITDDLTHP